MGTIQKYQIGHPAAQALGLAGNTAGPSMTDFERTFRPFTLKKGVELAVLPGEEFNRRRAGSRTVIVIDDESRIEDVDMMEDHEDINLGQMSREGSSGV